MVVKPDTGRKFTRIPFGRHVKLNFNHDTYYSKIENLSLTGMFIIGKFQKYDGKDCHIDLYQAEKSIDLNLSLQASAKVVRKNEKGIAIEFISMPHESYMFLKSILPKPNDYPCEITDDFFH